MMLDTLIHLSRLTGALVALFALAVVGCAAGVATVGLMLGKMLRRGRP